LCDRGPPAVKVKEVKLSRQGIALINMQNKPVLDNAAASRRISQLGLLRLAERGITIDQHKFLMNDKKNECHIAL